MAETYAVNVADMTADPFIFGMTLAPFRGDFVVTEPGHIDGGAVTLLCDDTRAEAILSILGQGLAPHKMRTYRQGPRGGWRRLTPADWKALHKRAAARADAEATRTGA
mgnify:CR=1 FL=1